MFCRKFEIETDLHNTDVFVVDSRGEYGKFFGACVATLKTTGSYDFSYSLKTLQVSRTALQSFDRLYKNRKNLLTVYFENSVNLFAVLPCAKAFLSPF